MIRASQTYSSVVKAGHGPATNMFLPIDVPSFERAVKAASGYRLSFPLLFDIEVN